MICWSAAEVAHRNEMYDRSINAANRTVALHDFNLRYPAPYREALQSPIHEHDLEEAWVYGLMRQESRFANQGQVGCRCGGIDADHAGNGPLGGTPYRYEGLPQRSYSSTGCESQARHVLHEDCVHQFDDNPVLASAAYNAGPTRARNGAATVALEGAIYVGDHPVRRDPRLREESDEQHRLLFQAVRPTAPNHSKSVWA